MRIILLDHSGSMGQPFGGQAEFAGRTRTTELSVKLDAAKTELLRSVASLASATAIALFEFTSTASLIYEGMSNNQAAIQRALDALAAEDGTDIAAALDKASDYAAKSTNAPVVQVLVISDGLSERASAEAAAQGFAQRSAVIVNVILIDPTEGGEQVARAIAVNGEVYAVTSSAEFAERITGVTKEQEQLARQIDAVLSECQTEEDATTAKVSPGERLSFTAAYPGAVSAGSWYSLLIYLHLADLQDQVAEIIRQRATQIGLRPLTSSAEPSTLLNRGTWLRFTPRLEGVAFNPLSQEVAWLEDIQELGFRLIADKSMVGRPLLGSVDVCCGPALIAQIPLSISVRELAGETAASVTSRAQVFGRIFASYSHKDIPIVEACTAVYQALGIYVYIDKHSLRSGQLWRPMLRRFIDKSDLFQLYWSQASRQSTAVEDEWRYALSLSGRKGESFIRPLYWEEEWPKPPDELSHIHFAKLDLDALAVGTGQTNLPSQIPQSLTAEATPSFPVTVVPVQPGILPEVRKTVQQDVAYAVSFLEETTLLRYYPVPTLLVDEHVVKSVRSLDTVDLTPQSSQIDQALALSDLLRSIELEFHVRGWRPKSSELENWETLFGVEKIVTTEQYNCLRRFCEGMLQETVRQYIRPGWLQARADMSGEVAGVSQNQSFSAFIVAALDHAISTSKPERSEHGRTSWHRGESDEHKLLKDLMSRVGIQLLSAQQDHVSSSFGETSFDTPLSALRFCRQELSLGLSNYDDVDTALPMDPIPEREKYHALSAMAGMLARDVSRYDSPLQHLDEWLAGVVDPVWRGMRDELARVNFHDFDANTDYLRFISACLDTILRMLQEGLANLGNFGAECRYAIDKSSWDIVQKEFPDLKLNPRTKKSSFRDKEEVNLEGQFSEFVRVYAEAKEHLLHVLSQRKESRTPLEQLFVVQAPMYGIYVPANSRPADDQLKRWAFDRGIPTELTFPQNSRVLFCLRALEKFEKTLEETSTERQKVQQMARQFQCSVLIHEHFHAILETGLDDKSSTATGVGFQEAWRSASQLNESLAVWMELHAARQNSELTRLVWSYIRAGSYPEWPYRGAESIEAMYQQQGIDAIRDLMRSLRRDPETAKAAFDSIR